MSSTIIIELEGFQISPDKFIVKEVAVCTEDGLTGNWRFKPPYSFEVLGIKKQIEYSWVSRNIYGIRWDYGHLPYAELYSNLSYLFNKYSCINIKGYQKRNFLEFLSGSDCFDIKYSKVGGFSVVCPHHHKKHFQHCALHKAIAYRKALIDSVFKL
ncbi:hypothetical protein AVEN_56941-1 [Araneus ventricosus]|uniref:Uncharacterized protein n=1 Tax=Araneus ventricosus TaxID=182803 RepID=A0A4Y2EV19_ARAVE|nr:hypothetical protein AVEN_56941-1 [Araneus ventricosus]